MTEMKIQDNYAEKFIHVFSNMKGYTDTITLFFRENGLYSQGMDSAHISMYELYFNKDWFENYPDNLNMEMSLNTNIFQHVLSVYNTDYSIVLDVSKSNVIGICFIPKTTIISAKQFHIQLLSIDSETLEIPEQEYNVIANMDTKRMKSEIDELQLFGENMKFNCDENHIKLCVRNDVCSSETIISKESMNHYKVDESIHVQFQMKMLHTFMKFHKLSDNVTLFIGENIPMIIKYPQDDNHSFVRFFLAPKIIDESDDDNDNDSEEY